MIIHKIALYLTLMLIPTLGLALEPSGKESVGQVQVSAAIKHDQSIPVREDKKQIKQGPLVVTPLRHAPYIESIESDIVVPESGTLKAVGPLVAVIAGPSMAGLGDGAYGFTVTTLPPDTNIAVGNTQVVQGVNTAFIVFDKATGSPVAGSPGSPTNSNGVITQSALWFGFGGNCENAGGTDIIVQYDKTANRWVLSHIPNTTSPDASGNFHLCVAVSSSNDATGPTTAPYNRYDFVYNVLADYPKMGVWPDAYYVTFNGFGGRNASRFMSTQVCALDRTNMLLGAPATQQCFSLPSNTVNALPSDLDGLTPPPAGKVNLILGLGSRTSQSALNAFNFHVDFLNSANSTLTPLTPIAVLPFTFACRSSGNCIPQPGIRVMLEGLGDRLMYRLAYRNLAGVEIWVVNHSINASFKTVSVRWYELHGDGSGNPVLFQQGTLDASDLINRWMGSMAMDKMGNIALGYSVGNSSIFPSIRYTGRVPTDPLGTMETENVLFNGSGSQTQYTRWGDYSGMSIDPVDDCTFWYTNEYEAVTGILWSTRIQSFKFPFCI